MSTYDVLTRSTGLPGPPPKRRTPGQRRVSAVLQYLRGMVIVGGLFGATIALVHSQILFILLPVAVSMIVTLFASRSRRTTLGIALLAVGVALVYFSAITGWELLTHPSSTSEIIVVTTTLAIATICEPGRAFIQAALEQRLRLRDDSSAKAILAFTTNVRREIDLAVVRERFLDVIQQTMQPHTVSLFTRVPVGERIELPSAAGQAAESHIQIEIDDTDPFRTYALNQPGVIDLDAVKLASPFLQSLGRDAPEKVLSLVSEGELLGVLALGPRMGNADYGREERAILSSLAAQVASALRVAYMVLAQQAEVRERERIEQELRTARTIQHAFLPKDVPVLPGWQIVPYYQSAREVGGDFYDILPFPDGRLGFVLGDVTGKGIPAALVMTAARTMIRTAAQIDPAPGEVLSRVNNLLHVDIPSGMFATCFYALLDPASGTVRYANAGQDAPLLRRADGAVDELFARGMPLGLMPGSLYDEAEAALAQDDGLFFFSDGLTEAHNPQREMFGVERVKSLSSRYGETTAFIETVLTQLHTFGGVGWEQEDDITLLALRRVGSLGQHPHPTSGATASALSSSDLD